jgi:endo-1,4-beta-xylanase
MNESIRKLRRTAALLLLCLLVPAMLMACASEGTSPVVSGEASQTPSPSPSASDPETDTAEVSLPDYASTSLAEAYADYFLIGTVYNPNSTSGKDKELLLKDFNVITPENLMKPQYMQPNEGEFVFAGSDNMIKFAQENDLKVVGHTLAWHQQTGNWLGINVTRDEAIEQLRSHITTIVGKYKGQVMSWDVVNEAINDGVSLPSNGDWTKCLRDTQWLKSIGPDYLALAFQFAHEADPDAKLYYNDYNLNVSQKAKIVHAMVKDLLAQGVPIHGIGMQAHYNTNIQAANVEASLKLFSELDVEISITELDMTVSGATATGLTEDQEKAQAVAYAKLFKLFKDYKDKIVRVTFWGTLDTRSWRAKQFPCLFNGDYTPKEAYYAVLDPEGYLGE